MFTRGHGREYWLLTGKRQQRWRRRKLCRKLQESPRSRAYSRYAGLGSSLGTPQRDPTKPKMSMADYKNLKQSGIRPHPRHPASTPEPGRPHGHARSSSNISNATPMARAPSFEGPLNGELQRNGGPVQSASKADYHGMRGDAERHNNFNAPHPSKPQPLNNGMNGHAEHPHRESLKNKEVNTQNKSNKSSLPAREPIKHSLPPRPQSPRRNFPEKQIHKRLHEAEEYGHAEKRAKIERPTPQSAQKSVTSRPDPISSKAKAPPSNLGRSDDHTSKAGRASVESRQNRSSKPDKPVNNLPPLLSPLPADLTGPTTFDSPKKAEQPKAASSSTPSKSKPNVSTAKKPPNRAISPQPPPLITTPPKSSPFNLPPLLSPTLPDIVEQELSKFKKRESDKHTPETRQDKPGLLTVEARHKEARRPDAPGVARKTTGGAIIGHPPKKSASNTPVHKSRDASKAETKSLIVKLPYSKKKAQTVERLVRLSPRPSTEFLRLEALLKEEGFEAMMAYGSKKKPSSDESEEEVPLAARNQKTSAKKRPSEGPLARTESSTKRAKASDSLDVSSARKTLPAALKSPVPSAPPQRNLLSTPKKGDALLPTAMRKIDSNDGSARTPQANNTTASTPASVERTRLNGERQPLTFQASEELAKTLKRKADRWLGNSSSTIEQRKLGGLILLESLSQYMRCFGGARAGTNSWPSLLPLYTYMSRSVKDLPVISAMVHQLHAITLEETVRSMILYHRMSDGKSEEGLKRDAIQLSKLQDYCRQRDNIWAQANLQSRNLKELQLKSPLLNCGPWTKVTDVTAFAMEVCAAFEKAENTGWRKEVDF
ncbi:hypothetical protein CJF30_00010342 [Rutstroemia sp. NJR-2017a BBW]|nr:hypothetical protein CJF30_00010342 [Rutstroemia sp. NJR-2017a BBW]